MLKTLEGERAFVVRMLENMCTSLLCCTRLSRRMVTGTHQQGHRPVTAAQPAQLPAHPLNQQLLQGLPGTHHSLLQKILINTAARDVCRIQLWSVPPSGGSIHV